MQCASHRSWAFFARSRIGGIAHALQARRAKESIHGIRARMRRRGPDSRERQMRQAPRERGCEAAQQLPLVVIEPAQAVSEQALPSVLAMPSNESRSSASSAADGACGKLPAQSSQALVDGRAHGREAHQLRSGAARRVASMSSLMPMRGSPAAVRGSGLDIGRQAEIDDERGARSGMSERAQSRLIQDRARACGDDDRRAHSGLRRETPQAPCTRAASVPRPLLCPLDRAVDDQQRHSRLVQERCAAPVIGDTPTSATGSRCGPPYASTLSTARSASDGGRVPALRR